MNHIDAFILVGGRSSRMGRNKATVVFRGSRMVDSVASAIRLALPKARIFIVAANNDQLAEIGDVANADTYIIDIDQFSGPVGGLHTAVSNSDAEWIFVAACDMPLLSAEFIAFLCEQIDKDYDVVVPVQPDSRLQPLAAFYRVESVRNRMLELGGHHEKSLSMLAVFEPMMVKQKSFESYRHLTDSQVLFQNVNSPDDILV
ncbi:MAG TPA: molybdenum cofactor guanylyltransferase [Pyrinomonadaceae bacterium]|nr:molybdenum cofactor guanylyltransferase [Pyrinomonadaceae bacterium]